MSVCICKYVDFKNYFHLYLTQKLYYNKTQITHTHTTHSLFNAKKNIHTLSLSLFLSNTLSISLGVMENVLYFFQCFNFYFH